jgi:sialic acid synthase SpsE
MFLQIVERHITLDKNMRGSDHKASLEPHELKEVISMVRRVESTFGSPQKVRIDINNKVILELMILTLISASFGH